MIGMQFVSAPGRFAFVGLYLQVVSNVNPPNDQYIPLLFDLTDRLGLKPSLPSRYTARLQRAPQGAGQSPSRGSHQVIQGGRMGLVDVQVYAIMLGNFGVDSEEGWLRLHGKICPA
jgi:hypothetical protein